MFRHRYVKFKCKKCGNIQSMGEDILWGAEKIVCTNCKNKFTGKDFKVFEELWKQLAKNDCFDVEIYTRTEFSTLQLSIQGTTSGDNAVQKRCQLLKREPPNCEQMLKDTDLSSTYYLALVIGAIKEYHQELRSALKEQGISIDGFIEDPLYPSNSIVD